MAGTIIKKIDGKKYLYFEYFEDSTTTQKYCGPEKSDKAQLKALEFEYEYVKKKRNVLNDKLSELKKEIKNSK